MREVTNINDATMAVIISESFGRKRIIKEIYFDSCSMAEMLQHISENYEYCVGYNSRIDIYPVRDGRKIARF